MSELTYLRHKNCGCCGKRLDKLSKSNLRRVNDNATLEKLKYVKTIRYPNSDYIIKIGDIVCGGCRKYANSQDTSFPPEYSLESGPSKSHVEHDIQQMDIDNEPYVEINEISIGIPRAIASTKSCVICRKTKNLMDVPDIAYVETFINKNIIIPNGDKCCKTHINRKNKFHKKDLDSIETVSNETILQDYEVKIILDRIRNTTNVSILEKFSHKSNINDDECKSYTGFTKKQFDEITNSLTAMRNTPNRDSSQALAIYLFWLKTGLDYKTIATLFSLDTFQNVGDY
jgi:hypothetical protein